MMIVLAFLAVIVVGLAAGLEAPSNAYITRATGSPLWAGLFVASIAASCALVMLVATRPRLASNWWSAPPAYVWLAGVYEVAIILLTGWAVPKLGAGTSLVVIVAAEVSLGVVLDQFGMIGVKQHSVSLLRIAGVLVVMAGATMVSRG